MYFNVKWGPGFCIICIKLTLQRSKLKFDQRLACKWHDVKNYICPVKFGTTDKRLKKHTEH